MRASALLVRSMRAFIPPDRCSLTDMVQTFIDFLLRVPDAVVLNFW